MECKNEWVKSLMNVCHLLQMAGVEPMYNSTAYTLNITLVTMITFMHKLAGC